MHFEENLEYWEKIINKFHMPVMLISKDKKILFQNKTSKNIFGLRVGEICWKGFWNGETLSKKDRELYENGIITNNMKCSFCKLEEALKRQNPINTEAFVCGNYWESWWVPLSKDICLLYFIDITKQKRVEEELKTARKSLEDSLSYHKALYENNPAMMLIVDGERTILDANPAFLKSTGYEKKDIVGKNASIIHVSQHHYEEFANIFERVVRGEEEINSLEYCLKSKKGDIIWVEVTGSTVILPDRKGVIWSAVDTTEAHRLKEELKHQAVHDQLTGLYNRYALEEELERAIERTKRGNDILAVCLIDLDSFKPINDKYGHDKGDEVLRVISSRLRGAVRKLDFVSRFGGDEFVVLLEAVKDVKNLDNIFRKIEKAVTDPVKLSSGEYVSVGLSMGVFIYTKDDIDDSEKVLYKADMAMYEAKKKKGNRDKFYEVYNL